MKISSNCHNIENAYQDTLKWIHSTARFGSKLGLGRTIKLLELLGNPQKHTKFIHITGTNGKGSVTAFTASILKEAGYRTGMFISPYLEDFRERIMLDGKKISKKDLIDVTQKVRKGVEQLAKEGFEHPTEFEINTAIAFLYFTQKNCDYAVLEVGMGGRFDSTNVITPVVSVITTVDFDHMDRLGYRLAEIAFEKAGIIKPNVPVVTGALRKEAFDVIKKRAEECNADLVTVGKTAPAHVTWTRSSHNELFGSQFIDISGPGFSLENVEVPLLGDHQQLNASLAIAALKAVSTLKPKENHPESSSEEQLKLHLDETAIRAGVAKTEWPGRLEVVYKDPYIILDAAHNPQGAKVLFDFMSKIQNKKIIGVFGILGDKCYKEQTEYIAQLSDRMIITKPHTPRALSPQVLSQEAKQYISDVVVQENLDNALQLAIDAATSDHIILCCGSLYLVGPARTFIRNKFGISPYGGE